MTIRWLNVYVKHFKRKELIAWSLMEHKLFLHVLPNRMTIMKVLKKFNRAEIQTRLPSRKWRHTGMRNWRSFQLKDLIPETMYNVWDNYPKFTWSWCKQLYTTVRTLTMRKNISYCQLKPITLTGTDMKNMKTIKAHFITMYEKQIWQTTSTDLQAAETGTGLNIFVSTQPWIPQPSPYLGRNYIG